MIKIDLPQYSRYKLCHMANKWLESITEPLFLNHYLDIEFLIQLMSKKFGLLYKEISLGAVGQQKILGLMAPDENCIYIDPILDQNQNMKRFTQAHEIAHWILHRNVDLADYDLADTEDRFDQHRSLTTTYDWVEWQANTFAAYLLIPEKRFSMALNKGMTLLHIKNQVKDIQPFEFYKLQKILAHQFQVSQTVIGIYYQHFKKQV